MQRPKEQVVMRDFPGLALEQDPRDVEAGAGREQTNLSSVSGQLRVRGGLALVTFEATTEES